MILQADVPPLRLAELREGGELALGHPLVPLLAPLREPRVDDPVDRHDAAGCDSIFDLQLEGLELVARDDVARSAADAHQGPVADLPPVPQHSRAVVAKAARRRAVEKQLPTGPPLGFGKRVGSVLGVGDTRREAQNRHEARHIRTVRPDGHGCSLLEWRRMSGAPPLP